MLRDPHEAARLAHDHQRQLEHEAAKSRHVAVPRDRHRAHHVPFAARVSHLALTLGLWLRARSEGQPSAEAIPAGGWQAMPLVLLHLSGDEMTSVGVRWPVYTLSQQAIERTSGYVILPATWLPNQPMEARA